MVINKSDIPDVENTCSESHGANQLTKERRRLLLEEGERWCRRICEADVPPNWRDCCAVRPSACRACDVTNFNWSERTEMAVPPVSLCRVAQVLGLDEESVDSLDERVPRIAGANRLVWRDELIPELIRVLKREARWRSRREPIEAWLSGEQAA